jgi:MoxR-like ATPase
MTLHFKHEEVAALVNADMATLLTGERGSGKTTLAMDVAKTLKLEFFSMSMTRQTTLSHLLGFINVNGVYVPSHIRKAAEQGGIVLLDEIDASDPNVILCLNTVENGYLSFPDKIINLHPDFRLMATSNPQDNHREYNGRAKLDAATLDRFDTIDVELDKDLEMSLVDFNTYSHMQLMRECLAKSNSSTYLSMRDSLRYQKRKELKLLQGFAKRLLKKDMIAYDQYTSQLHTIPNVSSISECETLEDVWDFALTE